MDPSWKLVEKMESQEKDKYQLRRKSLQLEKVDKLRQWRRGEKQ
jgi:hypothetical protein